MARTTSKLWQGICSFRGDIKCGPLTWKDRSMTDVPNQPFIHQSNCYVPLFFKHLWMLWWLRYNLLYCCLLLLPGYCGNKQAPNFSGLQQPTFISCPNYMEAAGWLKLGSALLCVSPRLGLVLKEQPLLWHAAGDLATPGSCIRSCCPCCVPTTKCGHVTYRGHRKPLRRGNKESWTIMQPTTL